MFAGAVDEVSGESARALVLAQMSDWNPELRRLIVRTEARSIGCIAVKSSVPIAAWITGRVTLLGEALHNMTPHREIRANTALRDAAALRDALSVVQEGRRDLVSALADYEQAMIDYGFAAVRAPLSNMKRLHARLPIRRFATKSLLRFADSSPVLQRRLINLG